MPCYLHCTTPEGKCYGSVPEARAPAALATGGAVKGQEDASLRASVFGKYGVTWAKDSSRNGRDAQPPLATTAMCLQAEASCRKLAGIPKLSALENSSSASLYCFRR